ncbi:LOW QUALITY PROTEIN: uncharacterized protein V3H86_014865 [Mergus octosetaceus]
MSRGHTGGGARGPRGGAMEAPQCLVQNGPDGVLSLNPGVLEVLRGIGQPVVVVAIAGRYRTGKSFLMNRLAQRRSGFPLGHAVQAHTKGIWMWCLPHPRRPTPTLVLLDTEGLGDPNKGDSRNDAWIFTLALLLSSTLVYNSSGTIDQQALETLGVVTALTERVRVRAGDSGDAAAADFVRFFPGFVWAVRDFVLELAVDGRRINEDEYLEHVLRLQPGSSRVVQEQNELRRCLRNFFPERKCLVLPPPAEPEAMKCLEELDEGQLRPGFLQQADAFCRHIWDTAPVKALPGRAVVTGSMLASLAERYVEAIGSSGVLCLESAVTALAAAENTAAVAAAVAEYRRRMEQELKLPTASQKALGDAHQRCEGRALALFMARIFADKEQRYQRQLMSKLQAAKEEFCRRNEAASEERCHAVLRELWRDVERRLDRGEYAGPGGSRRFQEHLGELMEEYHRRPGLGVKAAAVLEKFLQEHETLARALYAADQQLSEHEKERAASEVVAAAAAAAAAEAVRALEARQEEQRRSLEEHKRQLEEQLWHQQRVMLEEQERVIEHKLREQQALMQEGFERKAEALREQIRRLQEEKEEMKKPSWRQRALDGLGIAADIFLPGLARVAVSGALRLIRRVLVLVSFLLVLRAGMEEPLCLVRNRADGVLSADPAALEVLSSIRQPLVVVAIAGPYRTGKSFLMNRLAQRRSGFPLGHTVQAHTKGIWMWCLPHPRRADTTLVLLDTEGLGDPNKGDSRNDAWIFTLALLLSSTLVYNSSGTIDQQALENLELVSELTGFIRTRAGTGEWAGEAEDSEFVRFFPDFVWAVRDFTLELRADECPISEDEYLERALALKQGYGRQVVAYNTTRQCIRNYFPTRKCFVFPPPVGVEQQGRPEELPEAALQPGFLEQVERFCQHVLAASRPKQLQDGVELNGRTFSTVVRSYLETISSGRVPCLEGTTAAVAASENAAAAAEALVEYRKRMQDVVLPAEQHELSEAHNRWLQQALAVFHHRAFRDRDQQHQLKLMEELQAEYGALLQQNEEASCMRCQELLAELARPLEDNLAQGAYAQPGGYRAYRADRQRLVDAYREAPNKGTKAEEMLDKFLEGRKAEAEAVLRADNALTEVEKQLADQKQQAELLGQAQKAAEEHNKQLEVLLADQERSYQESLRMMEDKLQAEALKAQEEIKRAMEAKMKEQQRLLKQGFSERAKLLEDEVASLQKSLKTQDMVGHICKTLQVALKTACDVVIMLNQNKALK